MLHYRRLTQHYFAQCLGHQTLPVKLTLKQEKFCLKYIETGNATEAYKLVYGVGKQKPETVNRNAFKLTENNKIITRLAQLNDRALKRHDVTIDTITADLMEDRKSARDLDSPQLSVAVSATMGIAKVHGLLTDKVKVDGELTVVKKVFKVG